MGISGRIARFFQDSQLTPLLALVALLLGVFAVLVTPREEEPQINVTMANVLVAFPGASARDVEVLVATPAEQVLAQIRGVEHVFSVSRPGMAVLTVQFEVGVPRTEALVRLYNTIDSNRDWVSPTLGIGEPVIKPKGIDDVPIVTLTLFARNESSGAFDLERVAHSVEADLKRVPGTREIVTIGKILWEVREDRWDMVIVDAPPTGQIASYLRAPASISELVTTGRISSQADWMAETLSDPDRTRLVLVNLAEELPTTETLETLEWVEETEVVDETLRQHFVVGVGDHRDLACSRPGHGGQQGFDDLGHPRAVVPGKVDPRMELTHLPCRDDEDEGVLGVEAQDARHEGQEVGW